MDRSLGPDQSIYVTHACPPNDCNNHPTLSHAISFKLLVKLSLNHGQFVGDMLGLSPGPQGQVLRRISDVTAANRLVRLNHEIGFVCFFLSILLFLSFLVFFFSFHDKQSKKKSRQDLFYTNRVKVHLSNEWRGNFIIIIIIIC